MPVKALILDMTNVKDGGPSFKKRRLPEGDYLAKVTKVEDAVVKAGDNKGKPQWLFTIEIQGKSGATYPYYCQHEENQLWKIRNLFSAGGFTVPRQRVKLDPQKLIGKTIAVSLQDAEYEGKDQSEIGAVFPPAEMDGGAADDDDDEEEEDEEEGETPPPAKKKRKPAPEPEPEEDEEEEEDEQEEEPPPVKKKRRAPEPEPEEEEEDEEEEEEEEEEPAPRKRAAKKAAPRAGKRKVSDEELEELDIDDID